ncbi:hypothetical protein BJF78_05330 [Pseudonocardia sp. CNS-139]|nr:hypothetical protein BJF78_05330 [Pseudonocardia sp. CNS-139]
MTSRTLAVARYVAADVLRSQRWLLPVLAYGAVLGVLYGGDPGPAPGVWPATAFALYPLAAWLALVVANAEAPEQRPVTAVSAGGYGRVAAGTALVALAGGLVMAQLPVLVPLVVPRHPYPAALVLTGLVAHLAAAAAGTAVGLVCARPFVRRIGWSFCLGVAIVTVTAVQPWLPPVGTAVGAIVDGGPPPVASALLAVVLAGAAAAAGWAVERRR